MDPESAWQSAVRDLQLEMPRPTFDRWMGDARWLRFDDGVFTIGVPTDEHQAWLSSRLARILERQLAGFINGPAEVRFDVAPESCTGHDHDDGDLADEDPDSLDEFQLEELRLSLQDLFVNANREVLIPGYLKRWIPYLGPTLFWILVGFRQIMYLKTSQEPNTRQTFKAKGSEIIRWTGLSRSTFWAALNEPMLGWFLTKGPAGWTHDERTGRTKQNANRYQFVATTPLTPGDADALYAWLQAAGIRENAIAALEAALRTAPGEIFTDPPPALSAEHLNMLPAPRSVQNVVMLACEKTDKALRKQLAGLADDLAEHLMPRQDRLFVSWYFLQHWVPLLGAAPAAMVLLLRDKCFFSKDEVRDQVWVHGGDAEIARWLGLPRPKTVNEWLPPIFERPARPPKNAAHREAWESRRERREEKRRLVEHFLERTDYRPDGLAYAWQFRVRLKEPLVPEHQDLYDRLLDMVCDFAATGDRGPLEEILSGEKTKALSGLSKQEQRRDPDTEGRVSDSQNLNGGAFRTHAPANDGAIETLETAAKGANRTQAKARSGLNLKHLIKTTIGIKPLENFLKHLEEQTTPTTTVMRSPAGSVNGMKNPVGVGGWSFENILLSGGLSSEKTAKILAEIKASPAAGLRLLGWILYGFAHRSGTGRAGIDAPVIYAVSRYSGANPAPEYLELAQKSPAELLELLGSQFSRLTTQPESNLLAALEGSGFSELVLQTCKQT